jgi:hypothetical protein
MQTDKCAAVASAGITRVGGEIEVDEVVVVLTEAGDVGEDRDAVVRHLLVFRRGCGCYEYLDTNLHLR